MAALNVGPNAERNMGTVSVKMDADTTDITSKCRIIAKHLTALADELEGVDAKESKPTPPLPPPGRVILDGRGQIGEIHADGTITPMTKRTTRG